MEIIEIGKKLNKIDSVQSVHYENINGQHCYYITFKDWHKGGRYITLNQAKQLLNN